MTTHIRPNNGGGAGGNVTNSGNFAPTGAATNWEATSDNLDSSYMRAATVSGSLTLAFSGTSLAATQRCLAIRALFRASSSVGDTITYKFGNVGPPAHWTAAEVKGVLNDGHATKHDLVGAWQSTRDGGDEWLQTLIDDFQMNIVVGNADTRIYEVTGDLDIRTQASVVANAVTDIDTHWPLINWTPTINDGQTQTNFNIHIYDLAVNATPLPTDTLGLVWASGVTSSASTSKRVITGTTGIPAGTYKAFVAVSKDFNGTPWWSDWDSHNFTTTVNVAAPTALSVVASTLTTNTPTVSAHVVGPSLGLVAASAKAEFQFSTTSSFTTALRSFIGPDTDLTTSGTVTDAVPADQALNAGVWFYRARTIDQYGSVSGWCATSSFTISHPPVATTVAPVGGASVDYGTGDITFDFAFYDTAPDDAQSAYQVVVVDSTGTTIGDTGKTASTGTSAVVTLDPAYKDQTLRWKVKLWDSDDINSAYSSYAAFVASDLASVTITAPVDGGTVATPSPEADWTFSASGGRSQSAWRVSYVDVDGNTVHDSNWVFGGATSYTAPSPILLVNLATYTLLVRVRDSSNLESSATVTFTTGWTPPAAPIATVDADGYDSRGYVQIDWDDSTQDADWTAWRVYRKRDGDLLWSLVAETTDDESNYTVYDYLAEADVPVDYSAVQVATRFGSPVESDRDLVAVNVTPTGDKYWLLVGIDFTSSVRLDIVLSDHYADEFEQQEQLVAGRGRRTDYGTHWGKRGELTAKLIDNDNISARFAKQAVEYAKSIQSDFYLRNPFGDVWHISAGDIQFDREAGVGKQEIGILTVGYAEIYS